MATAYSTGGFNQSVPVCPSLFGGKFILTELSTYDLSMCVNSVHWFPCRNGHINPKHPNTLRLIRRILLKLVA